MAHAGSEAVVELVTELYAQNFAARYGPVSITPLVKPNAALLIGRDDAVGAARELIDRLDKPVQPQTQFQVFPLAHLGAQDAVDLVEEFYEERGGLGPRLRVNADFRSNALVVQGSPRDLQEVAELIQRLDVEDSRSESEIRVFRLNNSLAEDLAPVIQEAIRSDVEQRGIGATGGAAGQAGGARVQPRSTMLKMLAVDSNKQRLIRSGILSHVQVTADTRANAIVVRAQSAAMELIGELIRQLDQLPSEAQIKVFTIVNGDASSMAETLQELFGQTQLQGQPEPCWVQERAKARWCRCGSRSICEPTASSPAGRPPTCKWSRRFCCGSTKAIFATASRWSID